MRYKTRPIDTRLSAFSGINEGGTTVYSRQTGPSEKHGNNNRFNGHSPVTVLENSKTTQQVNSL